MMFGRRQRPLWPRPTREQGATPGQRPRIDRIAALLMSDRAGGVSLETLMRVL